MRGDGVKEGCEEGLQCGLHPGSLGTHRLLGRLVSSQCKGILCECSLAFSSQHVENLSWFPSLGTCPLSLLRPGSLFFNVVTCPCQFGPEVQAYRLDSSLSCPGKDSNR